MKRPYLFKVMSRAITGSLMLLALVAMTTAAQASIVNLKINSATGDSWQFALTISDMGAVIYDDPSSTAYVTGISVNGGPENPIIQYGSSSPGYLAFFIDESLNGLQFYSTAMLTDIDTNKFSWSQIVYRLATTGPYALDGASTYDDATHSLSGNGGTLSLTAVPEPSTYVLLTIALGVVGFARKRIVKGER